MCTYICKHKLSHSSSSPGASEEFFEQEREFDTNTYRVKNRS